jgi:hypothetical protein
MYVTGAKSIRPMIENLDFLPAWITRAGVPALSVMGFFWKGDEALSDDFKKWLSQKIMGIQSDGAEHCRH